MLFVCYFINNILKEKIFLPFIDFFSAILRAEYNSPYKSAPVKFTVSTAILWKLMFSDNVNLLQSIRKMSSLSL